MLAEREIALSNNVLPGRAPSPSHVPRYGHTHGYADNKDAMVALHASNGLLTTTNGSHIATQDTGVVAAVVSTTTNNNASSASSGAVASTSVWRSNDWEARQRRALLAGDASGSDSGSDTSPTINYDQKNIASAPSQSITSSNGMATRASSSYQQPDVDPIDHRWLSFNPPGMFMLYVWLRNVKRLIYSTNHSMIASLVGC
jgi:hypothetical protein